MNRHGPNINKDKEAEVKDLVQREQENKDVIRHRLGKAINRMKGVTELQLLNCNSLTLQKVLRLSTCDEVYEWDHITEDGGAICESNK